MLLEDIQLQQSDVTSLSSRSAIREFFGWLGYDASQARETFPQAEGMPQRLQEAVKFLELSASDEFGLLNVYLIELTSVTVAHIQALATHFKSRPGQVLAVLTQDYSRLDFVLFELREVSSTSSVGFRVLPRRFTFDREGPTPERLRVILRFLRRLTWTEPDGLAQWDKLKSAFSIAEWSEEFFDNRGLFADYFLKNRLPLQDAWNDPALRQARDDIRGEIAAARAQFREADETALRDGLLEPVVAKLGFDLRECKPAANDSTRLPDYELLDPQTGEKLAVCLAYQWGRLLDGPDPNDRLTPDENPGAAVLDLLQQGNDWAIVTNGKHWRLYSSRTESRATNFYQVDAEEAAADVPDAFRYFWLMFRAEAFRPCETTLAGETRTACFLEQLLDGSRRYAKEVGDRLKGRVFQDIFPVLSEGFIQDIRHRDGADADLGEEKLDLVYNATLTLLYRLLFLLYAESRDLLPVAELGGYYEKSLTALKDEVAAAAGTAEGQRDEHLAEAYSADPAQTRLWDRLTALFAIIGDGRSELNVPRYNGGLFLTHLDETVEDYERPLAEFLNSYALSDQHLARAIDRLARDPDDKTHGLVMIDYKSLGVRQLGSIYEGLLEFKVRIAQEQMAICTEKKKREVILPYAEAVKKKGVTIKRKGRRRDAEEEILQPGEVYLENSKHERKASGSYYTPEYIVKYIVEHTVGPVLDEKLEALRGDLNRACADFHKFREQKKAQGLPPHDGLIQGSDLERCVIQQCFDLSVLDPAMGSGHFLVTTVDFIADRLIHFLNGFPHNPIERMLNDTRRAILEQAVRERLVLDESKLTPINLLKRHVLKRCIYGVDLNPMAVELAKVSLWLHCFTLGAPLSFLDHHLKWGNSLIGETGGTGEEQGAQRGFDDFSRWHDFSTAVHKYLQVSGSEDATMAQMLASQDGFQAAEKILRPHRQKLNVQTAGYFVEPKNEKKRAIWVGQAEQKTTAEGQEGWQQAQDLANEHRFFHWPLEFPEVWYKPRPGAEQQAVMPKGDGEAGFDAVIGNPPWGAVVPAPVWSAIAAAYTEVASGIKDIFKLFIERAVGLVPLDRGRWGLVLPDILLLKSYPETRQFILKSTRVTDIAHTGRAFHDVNLDSCFVIGLSSGTPPGLEYELRVLTQDQGDPTVALRPFSEIVQVSDGYKFNLYMSGSRSEFVDFLRRVSVPLGDVLEIHEGIHTGNMRDILFSRDKPLGHPKPLIHRGDDVQPCVITWGGWWVDYNHLLVDRTRGFYANLGKPEWFASPKLLLRRTGDKVTAAYDDLGFFCSNNLFTCLPKASLSTTQFRNIEKWLNSPGVTAFFRIIQPRVGRLFAELKIEHAVQIPIPRIVLEDTPFATEWDLMADAVGIPEHLRKLAVDIAGMHTNFECGEKS
jgi:hypothetical protein